MQDKVLIIKHKKTDWYVLASLGAVCLILISFLPDGDRFWSGWISGLTIFSLCFALYIQFGGKFNVK